MKKLREILGMQLAVPLYDAVKHLSVNKYLSFLRNAWMWGNEEIEQYQVSRLRHLLSHASTNIPYYKSKFQSAGFVPNDFRSLADLKGIPCLNRNDIAALKTSIDIHRVEAKGIVSGSSSGTSGVPVSFYKDSATISMGKAAMYFFQMRGGWRLGDNTVLVWGNPKTVNEIWRKPSSRINAYLMNETRIPVCNINTSVDLNAALSVIHKARPDFILGYSNALASLAQHALRTNSTFLCKRVFTTADTLLEPAQMAIESALGPVLDFYGCSEINGVAFLCPDCCHYHVVSPHVYLEYEPIQGCDGYEILITDLDNYVMPFIRYRVGDIAIVGTRTNSCPSGTNWYSFKKLYGRLSNVIHYNDFVINPITYFGDSLGKLIASVLPSCTSYQTIWTGESFTTCLYMSHPPSNDSLSVLNSHMQLALGLFDVRHTFTHSNAPIEPSPNGKTSFFVDMSSR